MTREEFAEKWGYQSGVGYGSAQFDCKASLLKDLDVLIAEEVKNLALPHVINNEAEASSEGVAVCEHKQLIGEKGKDFAFCWDCGIKVSTKAN